MANYSPNLTPPQRALAALRHTGDEVHWTQVIAAVAHQDQQFVDAFAALVLSAAPHADRSALLPKPSGLRCHAEQWLTDPRTGTSAGRVDLVFRSPDDGFLLLVELKLHSPYGGQQLEGYLSALSDRPAGSAALVSITTALPEHGEDAVENQPRWLGSLRWSQLFDSLWDLPISDTELQDMWRAMLAVLRAQGDFGPMDVDTETIAAWGAGPKGRAQLDAFLRDLGPKARAAHRAELTRAYVSGGYDHLYLRFDDPVLKEERFRLQFIASGTDVWFRTEVRYPHPKEGLTIELQAITASLKSQGLIYENDGWSHVWAGAWSMSEWLDPTDPIEKLAELMCTAIDAVNASGILPALSALQPSTPASAEQTRVS